LLLFITIFFVVTYVIQSLFFRRYRGILKLLSVVIIILSGTYSVLWQTHHTAYYIIFGVVAGEFFFLLSLVISKLSIKRAIPQIALTRYVYRFLKAEKYV